MKILFLYMFPLYGNGSASMLREITAELIKRGHSVAILSPDKRKLPGVTHYQVTPPQNGVFVGHPELPNAKKFKDMSGKELGAIYTSYLETSLLAVADFNPDVVHAFHTVFLPSIAMLIKQLFGIRYFITTHGSDLTYLIEDKRFNNLIKDANSNATQITANSDFTKKTYLDLFGKSLQRKCRVIPGGVRLENYTKDQKDIDAIDTKFKLQGKKIVLFTGRLIKGKGVEYLIKAAPQIKGTIVIVGDGPERKNIEAEIKRKKVTNILLAGYINSDDKRNLHAFYERADVYVTPTVWEGFGLTILEAMAAHTPVIASNKGGIVSIIKNNSNGFLVPPRNGKAIAEAVNKILQDDALEKRVGDAAYKTVVEKFTWVKITDQYEQLYKAAFYEQPVTAVTITENTQPSQLFPLTTRLFPWNILGKVN